MGLLSGIIGNAGTVDPEELREKYGEMLMDDEDIELGFKLVRDVLVFTTHRLIVVDVQGVTGKKTHFLNIAYKSISRFSVETSGHFDIDAELKIWLSGENEPTLARTFNTKVDVYGLQKLLASHMS
jgi:hypothetical protein